MRTQLFALYATVGLVLLAFGPGVGTIAADAGNAPLGVTVTQDVDGSATVTVTANGTAVENASVAVDAPNTDYAGEGNYSTDENGTVGLSAPEEDVTIEVTATADSRTATTTATLTAPEDEEEASDPFGLSVASLVQRLLGSSDGQIGPIVASFAVENNPGNAPAHAGPPEFVVDDDSDDGDSEEDDEEESDDERDSNNGNGNNGNGPPN